MSTIKADTVSNLAGSSTTSMNNVVNGSAKAWVNFNGSGTVAIRASYNVSSITDLNVGYFRVNFTNAMLDSNYATQGTSTYYAGVSNIGLVVINSPTTTDVSLSTVYTATLGFDSPNVNVAIFR